MWLHFSEDRSKLPQVIRDKAKSGAYVKVREVLVVAVIIVKLGFPRIENQGRASVLGSLS